MLEHCHFLLLWGIYVCLERGEHLTPETFWFSNSSFLLIAALRACGLRHSVPFIIDFLSWTGSELGHRQGTGPGVANEVSWFKLAPCCWFGEVQFLYCVVHFLARGILISFISAGLLHCSFSTSSPRGNLPRFPFCLEASGPTRIPVFPPRMGLVFLGVMFSGLGHHRFPRLLSFSPHFLCYLCPLLRTGVGSRAAWLDLGVYLINHR